MWTTKSLALGDVWAGRFSAARAAAGQSLELAEATGLTLAAHCARCAPVNAVVAEQKNP